jgi:hypothetical protein
MKARYIFRCNFCKNTWAYDYVPVMLNPACAFSAYRRRDGDRLIAPEDDRTCPACQRIAKSPKIVNGYYRSDRPCDDRCLSAVGTECHCSCGGANHGSAWIYDNKSVVKQNI